MSSPTPPYPNMPPQQALPPAKKSNVLLWVISGVVAFLILILGTCSVIGYLAVRKVKQSGFDTALMQQNPAYAAAKMAATMAPNVETVSSDDSSGTITIRDKSTGKVTTMKFDGKTMVIVGEDGKESTLSVTGDGNTGGLDIKTAEGTAHIGTAAAGDIPDWVPRYPGSNPTGSYSAENGKSKTATFSFTTPDAPRKVMEYYQKQLETAGFKISFTTASDQGGILAAKRDASGQTVQVTTSAEGSGTNVMLAAITEK